MRSVSGAFIGLLLVVAAKFLGKFSGIDECLTASLGTSGLLVFFALPQSPMSQAWAVISGNVYFKMPAFDCCSSLDCGAS